MNKAIKELSILSLSLLIALALSCVGVEEKFHIKQGPIIAKDVSDKKDFPHHAYQNYAFACIAITNGDYEDAEIHLKEALKHDKDSPYLLMKLSEILVENGKIEDALHFAKKTVDLTPDDSKAREFLAEIYSRLKKDDLAISQYREILKKDPHNREAGLYLSTLYIRLKQYDHALNELSILIENEPTLTIAHYYKGRINLELKAYNKAKDAFNRVLELNPRFLPALFDLATLFNETANVDMEIKTYNKIVLLYPHNTIARERLIALYYKIGQEEFADEHIEVMKKILDPGDRKRKRIGLIYLKYGKLSESIAELTSIVTAWPNDQEARYYLGAALEENEDFTKAYQNLDLINPDSSYFTNARMRMAYILEKKKEVDKAIHLLKETLNHGKDNPQLYLMVASLYEIKEEFPNAMNILKEGLKSNDKNTGLHYRLGVVLDKLKRSEECIQQMEMVIKINPEHADALNYIGYTYADKGIYLDRAEELIKKALQFKPKSGYIIDSLGWVYFQKGLYDKALIEIKRAIELAPEDPAINEHLGDVYFNKKEYEEALKIYKKARALKNANQETLDKKIKDVMEHLKGNAP